VPKDVKLKDIVDIFARHGWGSDGCNHNDGRISYSLYQQQDMLPPFHVSLENHECFNYIAAVVPICDFDDNAYSIGEDNPLEFAVKLNRYYANFKIILNGSSLFAMVVLPLMNISEDDLIFFFEYEFSLVMQIVNQTGLFQASSKKSGESENGANH
jgi:hypothetical protein